MNKCKIRLSGRPKGYVLSAAMFLILLLGLFLFLMSGGWVIPIEFEAHKGERSIDPHTEVLLDMGFKVVYHKKRIGWAEWELEGKYQVYTKDGHKFMEGMCRDGYFDGEWVWWYETGEVMSKKYYDRGRQIGKETYWNGRGNRIREAYYHNARRHGPQTYWDSEGNIVIICHWIEDELNRLELYKDGEPKEIFEGREAREHALKLSEEQRQKYNGERDE